MFVVWCSIAVFAQNVPQAAPNSAPLVDPHATSYMEVSNREKMSTNASADAASGSTTNHPTHFDWQLSWKNWDGLHIALERRTLLGQHVVATTNHPGVHLEDTRLAGKIGAKFAVDAAAYSSKDPFVGLDDGVELRRARIYAKGDCLILLPVSYELEIGYIPGSFYIENSYLEFHNLGFLQFLGSIKAGQFHVPMSLVNYGSSRDMLFMESPSPVAALAPGVNAGLQVGRAVFNNRMAWELGLFTDAVGDDFGDATKGFGRVVGRVTGLLIYRHDPEHPESQTLLHLGLSSTAVYAGENTVRYRSRPESHLAPYLVDTGNIAADRAYVSGLEVAWVNGPLCVQGEFLHSWVQGANDSTESFDGFYAAASWFLTGESRPYDLKNGTFGRVIPKKNLNFRRGGWGAWELAGRFSFVDLNSGDIEGGRLAMLMAGVNWYLHPNIKWRFNYGFGHVTAHDPDGNLNLFQTRLEVDF